VERYSKHPLARAVLHAASDAGITLLEASEVSEPPGQGLQGVVVGRQVRLTSRKQLVAERHPDIDGLAPTSSGLECMVLLDGKYAGTLRFRDEPRAEGAPFLRHLAPKHDVKRFMLVSGDRESEVRYLAGRVGIEEVHAGKSPEEKLKIVKRETALGKTLYLGDGINDAPALLAATVGVALGQNSDITSEAAGAVIMDSSLRKVDEFFHISRSMRRIAMQSAVGGMALSLVGMFVAAAGHLPPVAGAICQEVIDVLAVANALRAAVPPRSLSDF
jgi:P-type E1-E2 ATPase